MNVSLSVTVLFRSA